MKKTFALLALCAATATPVAAEQAGGLFAMGAGLSGAAIAGVNAPEPAVTCENGTLQAGECVMTEVAQPRGIIAAVVVVGGVANANAAEATAVTE